MLAGLAAKALPTLLGGLATGLLSGAVKKAVSARGLYLHTPDVVMGFACINLDTVLKWNQQREMVCLCRLIGVHGEYFSTKSTVVNV